MRKRIQWLDAMKGFMIIFVVLCHSLVLNHNLGPQSHFDVVTLYVVNTFIMPCFFAISGFLYTRVRSWRQYAMLWYKKGVGLIIPYLFISIALYYYMHVKKPLTSILYQPIFLMWFLFALFFIFIIVGTMDLLRLPLIFQLILYVLLMVIQTKLNWWTGSDFDMNPIACVFGYLIFFYVGYLIKCFWIDLQKYLFNKRVTLTLFILLIVSLMIQAQFTGVFPYNTDQVMLSDVWTKMLSLVAFFSLFMAFNKIFTRKRLKVIGQSTLVIYLVHYFSIHVVFIWLISYTSVTSPILQTVIRLIAGLVFSLISIWLVKKIKILRIIFYPRYFLDPLIKEHVNSK